MRKSKIFLGILILIPMFISCQSVMNCVKDNGDAVTKDYNLKDFNGISYSVPGKLLLSQSDEFSVKIEAAQNIIDLIDTKIEDNVLYIKSEKCINLGKESSLKIHISCPEIVLLHVKGSGDIFQKTHWNFKNLDLYVGGSGNVNFKNIEVNGSLYNKVAGSGNINIEKLFVKGVLENKVSGSGYIQANELSTVGMKNSVSGSGNIDMFKLSHCNLIESKISGSGDIKISAIDTVITNSVSINGSGDYETTKTPSKLVSIDITGSGDASVNSIKNLNVKIKGSGDVKYIGNPLINSDIVGSGDIINAN